MKKLIGSFALAAAGLLGTASAQTYAITNGHLMVTGDASDPGEIVNGTIVVRDGRIAAIGPNVQVPENAEVFDAGGKPVTPGLFSPMTAVGLVEVGAADESNDSSVDRGVPFHASLRAADAINPDSSIIAVSRAAGVTRAFSALSPAGDSQFGGCGALIVLDGTATPVTRDCAAQVSSLGYTGARRAGDNRAASLAVFRKALEDARDYATDPYLYGQRPVEGRLSVADAKALGPVISGDMPIVIRAFSAADIRRTLDLAEEYGLDLILEGAAEAHRVADELAAADVPVILNPVSNLPYLFEDMGATLKAAGILEEAGVMVTFSDGETHNVRLMPQLAGNAVANGMSYDAALAAITVVPAQIYGVDDRLGTLAPGKIADLVVWSDDPLELSSRPRLVFVDGKPASLDNRQSALARRYRDLERGDLPPAYKGQ